MKATAQNPLIIEIDEYEKISGHISTYYRAKKNMHLREAKYKNKKRIMRYLHITRSIEGGFEGHISGPAGLDFIYSVTLNGPKNPTFNVTKAKGDRKELSRINRRLVKELLKRVDDEVKFKELDTKFSPKRISGQFYLRRDSDGMEFTHINILRALKYKAVSKEFLQKLLTWGFRIFQKK